MWHPNPIIDPIYELLWVKVGLGRDSLFVGALYHAPAPPYSNSDILRHIESAVFQIQNDHSGSRIVLAVDLDSLSDTEVVISSGLTSVVSQPTRGDSHLDRVYVSHLIYDNIKIVRSAVKSGHMAIVAYTGHVKRTISKTRSKQTFRKHTAAQHANFLACVTSPVHTVCLSSDPQEEYDRFYDTLLFLLDKYYPQQTVTVTSTDPPYVTPVVKHMLRQKNKFMRSGRVEKAAALATKIGLAIKNYNSAELSRDGVALKAKCMWAKVRQLTGRSKDQSNYNSAMSAELLNDHYAAISADANYEAPRVKHTCNY